MVVLNLQVLAPEFRRKFGAAHEMIFEESHFMRWSQGQFVLRQFASIVPFFSRFGEIRVAGFL